MLRFHTVCDQFFEIGADVTPEDMDFLESERFTITDSEALALATDHGLGDEWRAHAPHGRDVLVAHVLQWLGY